MESGCYTEGVFHRLRWGAGPCSLGMTKGRAMLPSLFDDAPDDPTEVVARGDGRVDPEMTPNLRRRRFANELLCSLGSYSVLVPHLREAD